MEEREKEYTHAHANYKGCNKQRKSFQWHLFFFYQLVACKWIHFFGEIIKRAKTIVYSSLVKNRKCTVWNVAAAAAAAV